MDDDGSLLAFAVGRKDWTNVMTAMCALYEHHGHRGLKMLQQAVGERAWVADDDERVVSWLVANQRTFKDLARLVEESRLLPMEERIGRFPHPNAVEYPPYRMANIYLGAWQRRFPPVTGELLILSDGIGGDYWEFPEIEAAQHAAKRAFEVTRSFALDWFEVRGFEVDRADCLVRLDGYEPLYMIHETDF